MHSDAHSMSPEDCGSSEEENFDETENVSDENEGTHDGDGDDVRVEEDTSALGKPVSSEKLSNIIRKDWSFPVFMSFFSLRPLC